MTPSSPHNSTMGTGDRSRISVTVFRLWGHLASGPRLVLVQSNCRISAPSSPPPLGNDPPCSADTLSFGNVHPSCIRQINRRKRATAAFVPAPVAELFAQPL